MRSRRCVRCRGRTSPSTGTVAVGDQGWDPTTAYPGDAYVDSVGQDVYDQKWGDSHATPEARWNSLVDAKHQGLQFWTDFAAEHNKPVSFAEWGLVAPGASMAHGGAGGDDPYFIARIHDWFADHDTAFEIYFDRTSGDGDHLLAHFPEAATAYRQLFGAA